MHLSILNAHVYAPVYTHAYAYVYAPVYANVFPHAYVYVYTHVYTLAHTLVAVSIAELRVGNLRPTDGRVMHTRATCARHQDEALHMSM